MNNSNASPIALTIAGSDSGGGAGIQADLRTFTANRVFGCSVVTAITAQSPRRVVEVKALSPDLVKAQFTEVLSYFPVGAIKLGMLANADIIKAVARVLQRHREIPVVVDPVMVASSGAVLVEEDAIGVYQERIFPLATVLTPNLDEAAILLGWRPSNVQELEGAALELSKMIHGDVYLKGGHLPGQHVVDIILAQGGSPERLVNERIAEVDTHGSGCTLASALAAGLAHGEDIPTASRRANAYIRQCLLQPIRFGSHALLGHKAWPGSGA